MAQSSTDSGFIARRASYDALVARAAAGEMLPPMALKQMERFEAELAERRGSELPALLTIEMATAYCGYSGNRTIYDAVKKDELARLSDGLFERAEVERWLAEVKRKQPNEKKLRQLLSLSGDDGVDGDDKDKPEFDSAAEEGRDRHFRARNEEVKFQRSQGELIEIAAAEAAFRGRVFEVKSGLLLFKRRVAHRIAEQCGVETGLVEKVIDSEVRQLLAAFARKVEINDRAVAG